MFDVLLWSYSLPGVGSKMVRELHRRFQNATDAEDRVMSYLRRNGIANKEECRYFELRAREIKKKIAEEECTAIPFWDNAYPALLKEIPDFPAFIFVKGRLGKGLFENGNQEYCRFVKDLGAVPERCVGIVGTRAMTEYGKHVVMDLVAPLCRMEMGIVSGLAYGVDREVHIASLNRADAACCPVAVLPGGPSVGVPYGNNDVFEKIIERGCAVWEFLPGTELKRNMFACRNRIIAGLSTCVVIVESDLSGGSLITAQCALDYGRDVCAVPGSVFSRVSRGTNSLLNEGAQVVRDGYDVLRVLGAPSEGDSQVNTSIMSIGGRILFSELSEGSGIEKEKIGMLFDKIKSGGVTIEEFSRVAEIGVTDVRRILTRLEVKGILMRNNAGLIILGERFV